MAASKSRCSRRATGSAAASTRGRWRTAPWSRWVPSSSFRATARCGRRWRGSGSGSGTRACATAAAIRSGSRFRRERWRRPWRRSSAELAASGGEGESAAAMLARLELDPGACAAILARTEVSAAAPADLVPAAELGLLARVSDEPSPGVAGGNDRLAKALAAALPEGALRLGTTVTAVASSADGVRVGTAAEEIAADACVVALPAPLVTGHRLRARAFSGADHGAGLDRVRPRGQAVRAA